MTTIDAEATRHNLPAPHFLKLDTHGFESRILAGASRTLGNTSLILMEVYTYPINADAIMFPEMCALMDRLGFRASDLCDPIHRPLDGALWQFDLLFEPKSAKVFQRVAWS